MTWIAPQSPPDDTARIAELRAELADLRPFLREALTPEAVIDLSARVAELVARIGDDR